MFKYLLKIKLNSDTKLSCVLFGDLYWCKR